MMYEFWIYIVVMGTHIGNIFNDTELYLQMVKMIDIMYILPQFLEEAK